MAIAGSLKALLEGKESTWGTPVTADKDMGLIQEVTTGFTREVQDIFGMGSIESQEIVNHSEMGTGSIVLLVQHGRPFEYVFGSVAHATSGSDERHTFSIIDTHPSFTLDDGEKAGTESKFQLAGCVVNQAELSWTLNDVIRLRLDFFCKTPTTAASASTPVLDTLGTFPQSMVSLTYDTVTLTYLQNFSLRIIKNSLPVHGSNSVALQQGFVDGMRFEFSFTAGFDDKTLADSALKTSGVALSFKGDNGTAYGSGQRLVQVDLANCQMSSMEKVGSVGGLTLMNIAGSGEFSTAIVTDDIGSGDFH